jgi:type I restriction enzyme S subunit
MRPYIRAANLTWNGVDLSDVKQMNFTEAESETYELRPGDVLVAEASGSRDEVGKPAVWRGEIQGCCFQNTVVRVRSHGPLPEYLRNFVLGEARSGRIGEASPGVGIHHIGSRRLAAWRVSLPPLAEQRRIVAAIEEQFSRLDAGVSDLSAGRARLEALWRAMLLRAFDESHPTAPLSEILEVTIGGVWGREPGAGEVDVLVFRVTEYRDDGILDPTTAARRSITQAQLSSRELRADDLLLEKSGGGPDRPVGRVAWVPVHRGPAVSSNFVQLLRVDKTRAIPRYVFYWLMRRYVDGSAAHHQTASTNIRNLKTADYLGLPIPLPPIDAQVTTALRLDSALALIRELRLTADRAIRQSESLRRAVLDRAFRGELVPQDPDDEPASILLERIRAERVAAPKPTRRKRATA